MANGKSPFATPTEKRSPFPRKSLPQAGESSQEAAFDLVFGSFICTASVAVTIAIMAGTELFAERLGARISAWHWLISAAGFGAVAVWQWFRMKPQLANLRLGIRGEREVGRMLEELRALGYSVFHDIPGDGFNIDHALIGPGGVFAIETKTFSKPVGRRGEVHYDGKRVLIDGQTPDRDPVAQAQASADHLRDIFKRMADYDVLPRPVVLFPGWWVTCRAKHARVWVLNVKALPTFVANEPSTLRREEIALLVDRLTLHLSSEIGRAHV